MSHKNENTRYTENRRNIKRVKEKEQVTIKADLSELNLLLNGDSMSHNDLDKCATVSKKPQIPA